MDCGASGVGFGKRRKRSAREPVADPLRLRAPRLRVSPRFLVINENYIDYLK
jgi:hypothetical protein